MVSGAYEVECHPLWHLWVVWELQRPLWLEGHGVVVGALYERDHCIWKKVRLRTLRLEWQIRP